MTKKKHTGKITHNESNSYSEQIYQFREDPEQLREMYFHLQWLKNDALEVLAGKRLPLEFFQKCERPKIRLVQNLRSLGMPVEEIRTIVSIAMKRFAEEYERTHDVTYYKNLSTFFEDEVTTTPAQNVRDMVFKYVQPRLFSVTSARSDLAAEKLSKIAGSSTNRACM